MNMEMQMAQEPTRQHSPLPWAAHDDDGTGTIPCVLASAVNEYGNFYAAQCNQYADAKFIARAANSHDALVAALGYVAEVIPAANYRKSDDSDQVQITVTVGWLREVAEVLSAAQEQSSPTTGVLK